MADRFVVRLTPDDHRFLNALLERRRCAPTTLIRALILRKADVAASGTNCRDEDIASATYASVSTVYRVRKRFAEEGLYAALFPSKRQRQRRGQLAGV
jgi:hypothetical protein